MPFNTLILTCLSSKRSFKDDGVTIRFTSPVNNEKILFFVIDPNPNRKSTAKDDFGIGNGRICDLILFYLDEGVNYKQVICFIELKKNRDDIPHGITQILNTYNSFEASLNNSLRNKRCSNTRSIKRKAYIYAHGGSLKHLKKYKTIKIINLLITQFGQYNKDCLISSNPDISEFIRN